MVYSGPVKRGGRTTRALGAIGLSIALAASSTRPVLADEGAATEGVTPAVARDAEERFQRGVKLFDDGDFKLALIEFQRSYALAHNYRVLYNIGQVEFQIGAFASA